MDARTLLDLAARYIRAQDAEAFAVMGGRPADDPEAIAAEFDTALAEYVKARA